VNVCVTELSSCVAKEKEKSFFFCFFLISQSPLFLAPSGLYDAACMRAESRGCSARPAVDYAANDVRAYIAFLQAVRKKEEKK
jgi:hypothetical protein